MCLSCAGQVLTCCLSAACHVPVRCLCCASPVPLGRPALHSWTRCMHLPAIPSYSLWYSCSSLYCCCVWQAGSSSDSEEEELLPMKRHAQQRSKRIEEEEEEETLPVRPAGRQTKKARTSGRALLPSTGNPLHHLCQHGSWQAQCSITFTHKCLQGHTPCSYCCAVQTALRLGRYFWPLKCALPSVQVISSHAYQV